MTKTFLCMCVCVCVCVILQEDEEWVDFAEQKEVDYSGLRIQTLQVK